MELAPKTAMPITLAMLCGAVAITGLSAYLLTMRTSMDSTTQFYKEGVQDINGVIINVSYPEIEAENKRIVLNESFDPKTWVSAFDQIDGEISDKIKIYGEVDNTTKGDYTLKYVVRNSYGLKTDKIIHVIVD